MNETAARRSFSIEWKLPLVIGALLLVAIGALTAAALIEVRGAAARTAGERLSNVAGQFSDLFRQSAAQIRQRTVPLGATPELATFARRRDGRHRAAALARLSALDRGAVNPEQIVTTELRDAAGNVLLATAAEPVLANARLPEAIPSVEPTDSGAVGRFVMLRDTLVYPTVIPVTGDAYVVRWRRMVGSRRTREQLEQLVGSGARIMLGNAQGEGWHDLEQPIPRPAFADLQPNAVGSTSIAGSRTSADGLMVHLRSIAGTPWQVAVVFPEAQVYAPVAAVARRLALIAALALLVGLLGAWWLSRRITRPIIQLTDAAEGMAAGLYGQQVRLDSRDELGRLAESFSAMSAEVQRTRDDLEDLVEQRTTELLEAQEALVRRERLAMLGQLSSGVGHELRNPLGVMTNSVYYLKTVLRNSPPKVHEYLDIISQQVALSEKIVSDLLDFARQKPPRRQPTPLAHVTDQQIDRLGKRDGVRIELRIPPDLPDVLADPVQVGQVIFNLLTNAVQALGSGGVITVAAEHSMGAVLYTVADTGTGIPPENLEKIFEPLFTTKARGIGLGLAVSRTIARANGGELSVTSRAGQGAEFTLRLDAVSNPALAGTPSSVAGDMA